MLKAYFFAYGGSLSERELATAMQWTDGRLVSKRFSMIVDEAVFLSAQYGVGVKISVRIEYAEELVARVIIRTRQEFARVYADVYAKAYHDGSLRSQLIRTMTIAE